MKTHDPQKQALIKQLIDLINVTDSDPVTADRDELHISFGSRFLNGHGPSTFYKIQKIQEQSRRLALAPNDTGPRHLMLVKS